MGKSVSSNRTISVPVCYPVCDGGKRKCISKGRALHEGDTHIRPVRGGTINVVTGVFKHREDAASRRYVETCRYMQMVERAFNDKIEQIVGVVKQGIHSPALLESLQELEQDKATLKEKLVLAQQERPAVEDIAPAAYRNYCEMIKKLPEVLTDDVMNARQPLKTLLGGHVLLHPHNETLKIEIPNIAESLYAAVAVSGMQMPVVPRTGHSKHFIIIPAVIKRGAND